MMQATKAVLVALPMLLVALSGCAGGDEDDGTAPPVEGAGECTLTLPDGSDQGCESAGFADITVQAQPPSLDDGWVCTNYYTGEGRMSLIYRDDAGRLGSYWDYRELVGSMTDRPANGTATVHFGAYDSRGAYSAHLPLDRDNPRGFAATSYTLAPGETVVVVVYLRIFWLLEEDTMQVVPAEKAGLLWDSWGADPWYAWQYNTTAGPVYYDLMENRTTDYGSTITPGEYRKVTTGDQNLTAVLWQHGVRFTFPQGASLPNSQCNAPAL